MNYPPEGAAKNIDILEKIADLHIQATQERSHFYVGSVLREAATEIMRLREMLQTRRIDALQAKEEADDTTTKAEL